MAESIIGKNLDNITNVAKGIDKEFLDMTYPDKYYRDVINPAKLGKAPIPSKMEMIGQSIKSFGPFKAMFIGAQPGKYGERAMPTKPAQQFLNTLGKGAKFVGTKVGPLSFMDLFASTPLGADDEVTQEMRDSIDTTGINSFRGDYTRASNKEFQNLLSEPRDYTEGELYDIDDTGRIPTITDRLKGGLGSIRDTVTDKLGSVGDFITGGGILGSIISGLGSRGDLSTRGIAGLNVNDVFNIDSFSSDEDPTKDPYGINIVSARGNYNEYVKNKARELAKMQFKTKTGQQRQQFYKDAAEKVRAEERRKEEIAQRAFLASQNRGGDGPQNNPQGGLGRQDYSRAATADFASLADEMGIDYR